MYLDEQRILIVSSFGIGLIAGIRTGREMQSIFQYLPYSVAWGVGNTLVHTFFTYQVSKLVANFLLRLYRWDLPTLDASRFDLGQLPTWFQQQELRRQEIRHDLGIYRILNNNPYAPTSYWSWEARINRYL